MPFSCNTYKKHAVPPSSQKLLSFFFQELSSLPLGASEPLWLPLRLPSSVPSSKFRILQLLCLQLIRKHRGCGGILPISALIARPSALIARSSSGLFQQHNCGGGGTLIPYFITSYFLTSLLFPVTSHNSPVTNRCIISPREHPPERSRMPGPGLPHRKRNHHPRILSAFPERPGQRLQSEIEPRSGHESRRSHRPPSPAFAGRTIPGPLRQRLGQPRHHVRAPPPATLHLLPPRHSHPLRPIAARPADPRRTSHPRHAPASFRRPERRAIQSAAPDEARAPARQGPSPAARHQRGPLRASLVRRSRVRRAKAGQSGRRKHNAFCRDAQRAVS